MELATAHLLTALYSLSTGLGLTAEDRKELEARGMPLSPALWDETRTTLELADRGGAGTQLDLGFTPAIFSWLGIADEREFIERYGAGGVDEVLARDCGMLSQAAAALEGDRSRPLPLELSHAWSARAARLMDGLPGTGQAVLVSLELALDGFRRDPEWLRPLFEAILRVADLVGDDHRSQGARKMLERLDEPGSDAPESLPLGVVAQVLTVLYCCSVDGLLLDEERLLAPGNELSSETWESIVGAAREGRVDDIPVPVRLLRAWGAPEDVHDAAVRDCLSRAASVLPEVVAEVGRLWGGTEAPGVSQGVARSVASIAFLRHHQLREGLPPMTGEPDNPSHDVHQGARRAARTAGVSLLARVLSRTCPDARKESVQLAVEAVDANDARDVLSSDALAELADIVQYAGSDIAPARRADDLVSNMAGGVPPPAEWLGAAVARRCHALFSGDAPQWLARLADAGRVAPAALARFVVDRVEVLLWWRSEIERRVIAPVPADPDCPLSRSHEEGRLKAIRHEARSEAVAMALRARVSLGYAGDDENDSDDGTGHRILFARSWAPHLPVIESCFGQQLVVCLRASELAQLVWFGAGEASHTDLVVALEAFDNERIRWIRWAGESTAIGDTDAIPGLTPETRVRLLRVFEAGEYVEDSAVRDAGSDWLTRWHETERR